MPTNRSWSLSSVWNQSLDAPIERSLQERDYIWASELGGSIYDRYFKMHGRKPTTPPNFRSKRKFQAGDIIEWVVMQVLKRAGVYETTQEYIVNTKGAMKVTGKCDFIAGGQIQDVDFSDLPDSIKALSESAITSLREQYPEGLARQILEVKSCSGPMFNRYEIEPALHHVLQAFHYAHNLDIAAHLVYVSRDDLRQCEYIILPNHQKYKELYYADIERIAKAYELPVKEASETLREPLLLYEGGKFKSNFRVEYSSYLTDYGFHQPDEYRDKAKVATRLNNVLKRLREGKELTKVNQEALRLGVEFWPEVNNIKL